MVKNSDLDALLRKLIIQAVYPGGVCLSDGKLIGYVSGRISETERERIEIHLEDCPHCRQKVDELLKASIWFNKKKEEIFTRFMKNTKTHLSDVLVFSYVRGLICQDKKGRQLIEGMERHLEFCSYCRSRIERNVTMLKMMTSMRYTEIRESIEKAKLAAELINGLAELALVRRALRKKMKFQESKRGIEGETLEAVVLDINGKLSLDAESSPLTVEFGVIKAEIDRRGFLTFDLSTSDRNYWEEGKRVYILETSLEHEDKRLVLPSDKIHSNGRVTICTPLNIDVQMKEIPKEAINLVVKPKPVGEVG
jgi:hypothetical protein